MMKCIQNFVIVRTDQQSSIVENFRKLFGFLTENKDDIRSSVLRTKSLKTQAFRGFYAVLCKNSSHNTNIWLTFPIVSKYHPHHHDTLRVVRKRDRKENTYRLIMGGTVTSTINPHLSTLRLVVLHWALQDFFSYTLTRLGKRIRALF